MSIADYENVLHSARQLSPDEQLRLVAELARKCDSSGARKHRIVELRGLGKEVWKGIDAQEYVRKERDSWDG